MTVSQLRDYMMEKVVPEKVMPQNIVAYLMDEDAEIPELDAFTFLNRLRSLGIGSADFLYLLKGCSAPAEAVEKIENNPAMNLNSLIFTLESAGLTSQDYTRMLYTARQLWERTLTMRIENVDEPEPDVKEYVPRAKTAERFPEAADKRHSEEPEPHIPEKLTETARAEEPEEPSYPGEQPEAPPAKTETTEELHTEPAAVKQREAEEQDEAPPSHENAEAEEMYSVDSILAQITGGKSAEAPAQIKQPDITPEEPPAATAKAEAFEDTEPEQEPQAPPEEASEEKLSLNISARVYTETSQFEKLTEKTEKSAAESGDTDELSEAPEETPANIREPVRGGYHRGALITSAAGAAVVFAVGAAVGLMGFEQAAPTPQIYPAESTEQIFYSIYDSYYKGIIGGENIIPYSEQTAQLFGSGILAERPEGFGTFSVDGTLYVCENDCISVIDGAEILPPDNSSFVCMFRDDSALFAVFSGDESGIMRIESGSTVYTASQDGILTDIAITEKGVNLATAYVPPFDESFSIEQTECYMPSVCGEVIPAEAVLLSGAEGCGYGLSVSYDIAEGKPQRICAALCDPGAASADGSVFIAADGDGSVLVIAGEEAASEKAGKITAWAKAESGIIADLEQTAEGDFLYIRDSSGSIVSAMNNFEETVVSLGFSGDTLMVSGENGVFLTADLSDISDVKITSPVKKRGIIRGEYLLTEETADAGLKLTLYRLKEGEAAEVSSFTKTLTAAEKATLSPISSAVMCIADSSAGAAYSYFDGVSVVSEFVLFGRQHSIVTLYDDKTGITATAERDGKFVIVHNGTIQTAE